jgi:hypothetical protein
MGGTRTVDAEGRSHAYLDHTNGMFVLHPDVLLSGEWRARGIMWDTYIGLSLWLCLWP